MAIGDKPASLPRWADVGGDIDVPSSGRLDVGWEPSQLPPSQWFNWLFNLIYQWCAFLNALYTATARRVFIDGVYANGLVDGDRAIAGTDGWAIVAAGDDKVTNYQGGTQICQLDITPYVPTGAIITGVLLNCWPLGSIATQANRLQFSVYSKRFHNAGTPVNPPTEASISGPYYATDTAGAQIIDSGTVALTIDKTQYTYFIRVTGGTTVDGDRLYGAHVLFTDPGPANY